MTWSEITIGNLGHIVTGKTPPTHNRAFFDGPFPFVTPSDIGFRHYICLKTENTVTALTRDRFRNQFIPEGSVIVTCIGNTIGKTAISSTESLTNQQMNSIVVSESYDKKFVYYLMCHNTNRIRAVGLGGGAAQPIINKSTFSALKVRVPDRPIQTRIAEVLSAYDDLIAMNRRRIELLERSARLLFEEWFVYLRYSGHEHDKIINGVPEGWQSGKVEDFYDTASGGTPSRKVPSYFGGSIFWVKTQELNNGFILETEERITEEAINSSSAKVFPKGTVLVAMYGATIGETAILGVDAATNQACCAVLPRDHRANSAHAFVFSEPTNEV